MCLLRVINLWRHITIFYIHEPSFLLLEIFFSSQHQTLQMFHGNFLIVPFFLQTNGRKQRKTENINLFIVQIFVLCSILFLFLFLFSEYMNWNKTVLDKGCGNWRAKIEKRKTYTKVDNKRMRYTKTSTSTTTTSKKTALWQGQSLYFISSLCVSTTNKKYNNNHQ